MKHKKLMIMLTVSAIVLVILAMTMKTTIEKQREMQGIREKKIESLKEGLRIVKKVFLSLEGMGNSRERLEKIFGLSFQEIEKCLETGEGIEEKRETLETALRLIAEMLRKSPNQATRESWERTWETNVLQIEELLDNIEDC